jgi:transposase
MQAPDYEGVKILRACEAITQAPAPSHSIARGRAGPKLLASCAIR